MRSWVTPGKGCTKEDEDYLKKRFSECLVVILQQMNSRDAAMKEAKTYCSILLYKGNLRLTTVP